MTVLDACDVHGKSMSCELWW